MPLREHTLLIDLDFFSVLFQLPSEGLTDFSEVPYIQFRKQLANSQLRQNLSNPLG